MEKETDPRIHELTHLWCSDIWHSKYHLKAPWGGKEAKLLQRTLKWFDSNFPKKEDAKEECIDAMRRYVEERERYYADDKHPFSKFASKPEKWAHVWKKKEVKTWEPIVEEKRKVTWDDMEQWATENPRQAVKGFKQTFGVLKQLNPERYESFKNFLLDLVGKEQAIQWAREPEKTL